MYSYTRRLKWLSSRQEWLERRLKWLSRWVKGLQENEMAVQETGLIQQEIGMFAQGIAVLFSFSLHMHAYSQFPVTIGSTGLDGHEAMPIYFCCVASPSQCVITNLQFWPFQLAQRNILEMNTYAHEVEVHVHDFHLPDKQCYEFPTYANQKIYTVMPNTDYLVWSSSVAGEMMKFFWLVYVEQLLNMDLPYQLLPLLLCRWTQFACDFAYVSFDHNRQRGGAQVHTWTHPIYPILCLFVWLLALAQGYEIFWKLTNWTKR